MNKKQAALEMRRALQYFAATLENEEKLMAIPTVFPRFCVGTAYASGDIFSYGENSAHDPQLYSVLQNHISAEEWPPPEAPALYKAVGITSGGIAIWVQPLGASDAYTKGDTVSHGGAIWESSVDANIWEPGVYGWEVTEA